MAEEENDDKQYEPSQKKLDDARRKGDVPRSTDLTAAAGFGGFLLAWLAYGATMGVGFGDIGTTLFTRSANLAQALSEGPSSPIVGQLLIALGVVAAPLVVLPFAFALLSVVAQRGLVFAPSKLAPKGNRISPIENAKNKFGRKGLFEFAKSFAKLVLFSAALGLLLKFRAPEVLLSLRMTPGQISIVMGQLAGEFLMVVVLLMAALGALDFMFQRAEHMRKNRMSHKEMRDESKEAEGDPEMKQKRRSRAQEIAMNSMLADVPNASVVIVNPTHYAVALQWSPASPGAPVCLAKGVDDVAARIRERAAENDIPIHSDPPTARALYASVDIGSEVLPDHYRPVAAAIRFADDMRRRRKEQPW